MEQNKCADALLRCPKCQSPRVAIDPEDREYGFCWGHHGTIYLELPVRAMLSDEADWLDDLEDEDEPSPAPDPQLSQADKLIDALVKMALGKGTAENRIEAMKYMIDRAEGTLSTPLSSTPKRKKTAGQLATELGVSRRTLFRMRATDRTP